MSMYNNGQGYSLNSSIQKEQRPNVPTSTFTPRTALTPSKNAPAPYFLSIDDYTNLKSTLEINNDRITFLEQERTCYVEYIENASKLNSRFLYTSIMLPITLLGIMVSLLFFSVDTPYLKTIFSGIPSVALAFVGFKLGNTLPHEFKQLRESNIEAQKNIVSIKTKLQMK